MNEERIAVADGVTLRALRWQPAVTGDGAASFVLIHGLASNALIWQGVAGRLASAGHPVSAVDLRGHGRSDKPDTGYDYATVGDDVRAMLTALRFERPILVGQSWGASLVLDIGVRFPDAVRGIVVVDGALHDLQDGFADWDECWERLAPPQLVGLPLAEIEGYFRTHHSGWPEEGIDGSLGNFEVRPEGTIAPWLTRERHKAILRAMWETRATALWPRLRVPALIVPVDGGQAGWTEAKRAGAEAAVAALGESGTPARVHWFEGDHDVHAQRPAELAEVLLGAVRDGFFG